MRKNLTVLTVAALLTGVSSPPALAQQLIGYDGFGRPMCSGPLGPGPCDDVYRYLQQQGGFGAPPGAPGNMAGLPGAGLLPRDGQIVASIYQTCSGEPRCMAAAWAAVEVQRCRNGFGVEGGCFGPNGEIMRVINRFVPHNLQPNVIIHNVERDLREGPGPNNDLVGEDGWVCETFFGGC